MRGEDFQKRLKGKIEFYGEKIEFLFPENFAAFKKEICQALNINEEQLIHMTLTYNEKDGDIIKTVEDYNDFILHVKQKIIAAILIIKIEGDSNINSRNIRESKIKYNKKNYGNFYNNRNMNIYNNNIESSNNNISQSNINRINNFLNRNNNNIEANHNNDNNNEFLNNNYNNNNLNYNNFNNSNFNRKNINYNNYHNNERNNNNNYINNNFNNNNNNFNNNNLNSNFNNNIFNKNNNNNNLINNNDNSIHIINNSNNNSNFNNNNQVNNNNNNNYNNNHIKNNNINFIKEEQNLLEKYNIQEQIEILKEIEKANQNINNQNRNNFSNNEQINLEIFNITCSSCLKEPLERVMYYCKVCNMIFCEKCKIKQGLHPHPYNIIRNKEQFKEFKKIYKSKNSNNIKYLKDKIDEKLNDAAVFFGNLFE